MEEKINMVNGMISLDKKISLKMGCLQLANKKKSHAEK